MEKTTGKEKEEILQAVKEVTGKDLAVICAEKEDLRRLVMELLYRAGGIKGPEIGKLFGIDYAPVS